MANTRATVRVLVCGPSTGVARRIAGGCRRRVLRPGRRGGRRARRTLRECDAQLARYRAALDGGADPTVVAGWIADTQAKRARAKHALTTTGPATSISATGIRELLEGLPDKVHLLAEAPPDEKAGLYRAFGVNLTYRPACNVVEVTADSEGVEAGVRKLCRRGD